MENGNTSGPLSPKVNHEKQEEEAEVQGDEEMQERSQDITFGDLDIEEVAQHAILQQRVNRNSPGPSSANVDREQHGEVVVSDEEEETVEVRRPRLSQDPRDDHEIIDLTQEDEDVSHNMTDSTCPMENDEVVEVGYELFDWNEDDLLFPLWHSSTQFRELAKPFFDLAEYYGEDCYNECKHHYSREPTIAEFANFCVNEGVPDRNWYGELVLVNTERRGWPLQYAEKGKVYINGTTSSSKLDDAVVDWSYVVDGVRVKPGGPDSRDFIRLHMFNVTSIGEGETEFYNLETVKKIVVTVRKLMDCVWFPIDPENFTTFYNHALYQRLTLIFYLEFPCPTSGILSNFDRRHIISALKQYHNLKNSLIKVFPSQKVEDEAKMEDEDGVEMEVAKVLDHSDFDDEMSDDDDMDETGIKFEMEMKRHTLEMSFLLSPVIRPLLPFVSSADECDPVNPEEVILVMKETNVRTLKFVYEELEMYGIKEDANIKILPDLEVALKKGIAGTTVFVTSGNYSISGLWKLSDGGSIIGLKIENSDVTVSPSDAVGNVWLFMDGPEDSILKLKNLSMVVDTSVDDQLSTILHVKSGQLRLENCVIRDNSPGPRDALVGSIVKSEGATVKLDEPCVFTNVLDFTM